ncbi:MAG: hypothetical protein RL751_91 [Bacteroidota bacterium]
MLCSCAAHDEKFIPEKFEIARTVVRLPFDVKEIVAFEGGYVCNFENFNDTLFHIGFLDKNFHLKKQKTKQLNLGLQRLRAIWTAHDTLFAIDLNMIKYWRNAHWNFYKVLPIENKTTFMSYELNYPIYEDAQFIVRSCSKGEFGGAVFFKDKKTGKTYSCESTSIKAVDKIDGVYYVSSSLAHGCGFAKVLQIADPRRLYEIKNKSQGCDCGWYDIYSKDPFNDQIKHPSGYDKGFKVLVDTTDIQIIGAFVSKDFLYHIFSDAKNTYLGYFDDQKPVILDTIVQKVSRYGYVRDLQNNPNLFVMKSSHFNGVIVRDKHKIRLIEFKHTS